MKSVRFRIVPYDKVGSSSRLEVQRIPDQFRIFLKWIVLNENFQKLIKLVIAGFWIQIQSCQSIRIQEDKNDPQK
jgi:hypothetical protein